jgi:hypothetical protein
VGNDGVFDGKEFLSSAWVGPPEAGEAVGGGVVRRADVEYSPTAARASRLMYAVCDSSKESTIGGHTPHSATQAGMASPQAVARSAPMPLTPPGGNLAYPMRVSSTEGSSTFGIITPSAPMSRARLISAAAPAVLSVEELEIRTKAHVEERTVARMWSIVSPNVRCPVSVIVFQKSRRVGQPVYRVTRVFLL